MAKFHGSVAGLESRGSSSDRTILLGNIVQLHVRQSVRCWGIKRRGAIVAGTSAYPDQTKLPVRHRRRLLERIRLAHLPSA